MKQCIKCNTIKEITEFHKSKQRLDGYYPVCKSCRKLKSKQFYTKHKDKIKTRTNKYYHNNKETLLKKQQIRNKKRFIDDPAYRLSRRLRNRLYYALQFKSWKKNTHFSKYIGCSKEELIKYIESKFEPGMSWDNFKEWHIDHIIPLSSAKTEDEMYKLCHYTNLQPLWAKDNLSKGAKIDSAKSIDYSVKKITYHESKYLVELYHYSKILPKNTKYCFGLFKNDTLVGVCCFSTPSSPNYRKMLINDNGETILELNRLALINNIKNEASILISKSIKLLPKCIIITYADTKHNHLGVVYQSTNFGYYGLTEKRKEYNSIVHPRTAKNVGQDIEYRDRSRKHRYIYFNKIKVNIKYIKRTSYPKR